jgi:hypothetical protein
VTPAHERKAPENDLRRFCFDVAAPDLPAQRETWGCPSDAVEEIRLSHGVHKVYLDLVTDRSLYEGIVPATSVAAEFGKPRPSYDARHVLPFLVDAFSSLPRTLSVGWLGGRADTLFAFCLAWERLGFAGRVLVDRASVLYLPETLPAPVGVVDAAEIAASDIFVFDFGAPSVAAASNPSGHDAALIDALFEEFIRNAFVGLAEGELHRDRSLPPRRFICIDALGNQYHEVVHHYVRAAMAPFSVRLRQGFVLAGPEPPTPLWHWPAPELEVATTHRINLLPLLEAGDGGVRTKAGIIAPYGRRGYACRGPYQRLPVGDYRVEFTLMPRSVMTIAGALRPIILDVVAGGDRLAMSEERFLLRKTIGLNFSISAEAAQKSVELRIFRGRHIDFSVTAAVLTRLAPALAQLGVAVSRPDTPVRTLASQAVAL